MHHENISQQPYNFMTNLPIPTTDFWAAARRDCMEIHPAVGEGSESTAVPEDSLRCAGKAWAWMFLPGTLL